MTLVYFQCYIFILKIRIHPLHRYNDDKLLSDAKNVLLDVRLCDINQGKPYDLSFQMCYESIYRLIAHNSNRKGYDILLSLLNAIFPDIICKSKLSILCDICMYALRHNSYENNQIIDQIYEWFESKLHVNYLSINY